MKIYALRCPNCDGNLEIKDGLDTFFCKYCGYKIVLEGQSNEAYRSKGKIKGWQTNGMNTKNIELNMMIEKNTLIFGKNC